MQVASIQYVGVILFVFAKSVVRPHVRMVQGASRGIGLLGFGVCLAEHAEVANRREIRRAWHCA